MSDDSGFPMKRMIPAVGVPAFAATVAVFGVSSTKPAAEVFATDTLKPVLTSNQFVLKGEVVGRGDIGLTLLSRGSELTVVQVNRYTAIKKGAETIQLADINIGDRVSVTLMRSADGSLQAVNVEVRTGFEPHV